jgi:hypothetical protein
MNRRGFEAEVNKKIPLTAGLIKFYKDVYLLFPNILSNIMKRLMKSR